MRSCILWLAVAGALGLVLSAASATSAQDGSGWGVPYGQDAAGYPRAGHTRAGMAGSRRPGPAHPPDHGAGYPPGAGHPPDHGRWQHPGRGRHQPPPPQQHEQEWVQRPYPYHLDYYRMRYGGSYAPYFGNLYGPPAIFTSPFAWPQGFGQQGFGPPFGGAFFW